MALIVRDSPDSEEDHLGLDVEHVVRPDELFFSTTDRRGVIRSGNSVFERISQYPLSELLGAPHNIVRHPLMPAGAFRLLWDRLLAGQPAAAYVRNRARDGGSYWVFATVTPMGQGFLSVRMAPCGPHRAAVEQVYRQVVSLEEALAQGRGLSRTQVAEAGAQEIERLLAQAGFASYDAFMLEALPAEVAARAGLVDTAFARPGRTGPLAEILEHAHALDAGLDELGARLDYYGELAAALLPAAGSVLRDARRLEGATRAAREVSADAGAGAPVLLNVATVMGHPMADAVAALEALSPELSRVAEELRHQRFRVALTRLHTQMVAAFAAEAVDGRAPESALAEIPHLCDALHEDVVDLTARTDTANHALEGVARGVASAGDLLQEFRRFLGQWRILVMRHRLAAAVAETVGPIDEQLDAGHDQLDHLRGLARACRDAVAPLDAAAVDALLYAIRSAASRAA